MKTIKKLIFILFIFTLCYLTAKYPETIIRIYEFGFNLFKALFGFIKDKISAATIN